MVREEQRRVTLWCNFSSPFECSAPSDASVTLAQVQVLSARAVNSVRRVQFSNSR